MNKHPKLKKLKEKEAFEHNQFWVKIDKEFDQLKRESFEIVHIIRGNYSLINYKKIYSSFIIYSALNKFLFDFFNLHTIN